MKQTRNKSLRRPLAGLLAALLLGGALLPLSLLPTAAGADDLARGKHAFACHSESDSLAPARAVDGNSGSRFAAGGGCAHDTWFVLDLGDNYVLSDVNINWEAAHPSSYVLELSDDGRNYTEMKTVSASGAGWTKTAVSGTGRFLRIRETARALAAYGFSIYDLEVYGTPAAERNDATYRHVQVSDSIRNGTVTVSPTGFVRDGETVTVSVSPMTGGTLTSLSVGGQNVTDKVQNGIYTFKATADTLISAEFAAPPTDRYECEDALVLDKDGVTPIGGTVLADADASGGKVAGGTGGRYFIFENVVEANCIQIAYSTHNTNYMNLSIRFPWEEEYHDAGLIHFSTSNSWNMSSSYIAASSLVYIPAGSDIKLRPNVDVNLDCLWLTSEIANDSADAPAHVVTATDMDASADADLMATYGHSFSIPAYHADDLTVPAGKDRYNVLSLSYRASEPTVVTVEKDSTVIGTLTLEPTPTRTFATAGLRTVDYAPGDKLVLTCQSGEVWLDYVAVNYAPDAEVVTVGEMPAAGERLTVSLNGTWEMGTQKIISEDIPATVPDGLAFVNALPVPGLWHSAAYDAGEYVGTLTWLRKTVVLPESPADQVLLYIGQAQYGRHIYVNGRFAESYHYNYSHSYTDISDYLRAGENEITILLGTWSEQKNDPDCPTHVLYDGESTDDEPGVTDRVELIFSGTPHVHAVQTNPHLDAGTVDVQVTLKNFGNTAVTGDVTISVYELGVYKDGKPTGTEKKVAETTLSSVKVEAGGEHVVLSEALKLSDWSRAKCWTPDSPFLYRLEIQTAGDTHTSRFGMRTFDFDPETKYARLNGEIFFLMGTNVAIERYYDDPLCGTTPWEEDWIRKLYTEFREVGWNAFRTHLGNANELWFDLADEMGMMIVDEYAQWGDQDGCTLETFLPEIYAWMDQRAPHPSLIIFDAQNEAANDTVTDEIIRRGREYDLQMRPWENGWRAPVGENDPIECHPYHIGVQGISGLSNMNTSTPVITLADIGLRAEDHTDHPFFVNEHGEYWINREGKPMSGTAGTWASALPNATDEERLVYYADLMAAQMEAYRAGRAYVGLFFFCGLASSTSSAQGVTSDILAPDVSTAETLQIRPYIKERLSNAFADIGISIGYYEEELRRGTSVGLPITLINDTGTLVADLPVTLRITSGDTVLFEQTLTMSVDAFSGGKTGTATEVIDLWVPADKVLCRDGQVLLVTASYTLDGETVSSIRKWEMRGGRFDDGVTETETGAPDTSPESLPVETTPVESESDGTTPVTAAPEIPESTPMTEGANETPVPAEKGGGCSSTVSLCGLLLLSSAAAVCIKRRRA